MFGQLTAFEASPYVCIPQLYISFDAVPVSFLLHFISLCVALVIVFLSRLLFIAYTTAFFA